MTKNKKELEELQERLLTLQKDIANIHFNISLQQEMQKYHVKIIEHNRNNITTIVNNIKVLEKRRKKLIPASEKLMEEIHKKGAVFNTG